MLSGSRAAALRKKPKQYKARSPQRLSHVSVLQSHAHGNPWQSDAAKKYVSEQSHGRKRIIEDTDVACAKVKRMQKSNSLVLLRACYRPRHVCACMRPCVCMRVCPCVICLCCSLVPSLQTGTQYCLQARHHQHSAPLMLVYQLHCVCVCVSVCTCLCHGLIFPCCCLVSCALVTLLYCSQAKHY